VSRLVTLLSEGVHQLVVGPRRQGKTTICQAATGTLGSGGMYVVEVDLFALATLTRMAEVLVDQAIGNRAALHRAGRAITKGGRSAAAIVGSAAQARLRTELGEGIELVFEPRGPRSDPRRHFEHALRLLQRICDHDGATLVLFIDEFQELGAQRAPFGDADEIMNLMRSVLQESPAVTCLFAGSSEHMMRDLLGEDHRAFYQWGAWYELEPIAASTWKLGLSERLVGTSVTFDPTALARLVDLGEGQARITMLLAQQAYLVAVTEDLGLIDAGTVEVAVELALRATSAAHQVTVDQIRDLGRHALDVAVRIARGEPPYRKGNAPRTIQRAIEMLSSKGLVEQRGVVGRGGWVVPDPLLRRVLARMAGD